MTVLNWIKGIGQDIKDYAFSSIPDKVEEIDVVEVDEMLWHFTDKKSENYGFGLLFPEKLKKSSPSLLVAVAKKQQRNYGESWNGIRSTML